MRCLRAGARYPRIALAVSGGADSMALMRLAHAWTQRGTATGTAPRLIILTVDHGLRAAAAEEAETVKRAAAALGLDHHTLVWDGPKPATGIQAKARAARYALLCDACRTHCIPALATAHTADDQAETLVMRLARGSGLDGLAGIASVSTTDGIEIQRPLLGTTRARLVATLTAFGQSWIDDPSNDDEHYERVRVRQSLCAVPAPLGLTTEALALSAHRLRRARDAIEATTTTLLRSALTVHAAGFGEIAQAALFDAPNEIAIKALARLANTFGRHTEPLRMIKLESAYALLRAGSRGTTLGGCRLLPRRGKLLAVREFGRMDTAPMRLPPEGPISWDERFTIAPPPTCRAAFDLRPLGRDGLDAIKKVGGSFGDIPRIAALTLPSLWQDAEIRYAHCAVWSDGGMPRGWLADCGVNFANTHVLYP